MTVCLSEPLMRKMPFANLTDAGEVHVTVEFGKSDSVFLSVPLF